MKDQYAADIGDFGKYLFLNYMVYSYGSLKETDYSLGVNWYYTYNDSTSDGKHTDYLSNDKDKLSLSLEPYSSRVYPKLQQVNESERSLANIEKLKLLPPGTVYFRKPVSQPGRAEWLNESLDVMSQCDLVFLDPDNGIIDSEDSRNIKSVLSAELARYYRDLDSNLIIYYHFNRFKGSIEDNVYNDIIPILRNIDPDMRFRIIVYRKVNPRFYIIINKRKDINLYLKLDLFLESISPDIFYEIPLAPGNYNTNKIIESENEVIIQDFPIGNNKELILAGKRAAKSDMKVIDLPESDTREIQVDLVYTPMEYKRMCYGFIPQAMEDRWKIYEESNKLYFHRSWTGICIYILEFIKRKNIYRVGTVWANTKEGEQDDIQAVKTLEGIINNLLLSNY